jgi:hypothetical protein
VVTIFTRSITDNLTSLVRLVDKQLEENEDKKLAAFVVLLSNDPDADEIELKELAEKQEIKNIPLTIYDGIAGPPNYNIAEDVDLTVLHWKGQKVVVNHAFAKGELKVDGVTKVVESTAKILE